MSKMDVDKRRRTSIEKPTQEKAHEIKQKEEDPSKKLLGEKHYSSEEDSKAPSKKQTLHR